MRSRFFRAGTALAVIALLVVPTAAARGEVRVETAVSLSGLPSTIGYADRQQTAQGILQTRVVAGLTPQPVSGATITVFEIEDDNSVDVTLGTTITDANGHYSLQVTLVGPGEVVANYAGDTTYFRSRGEAPRITASALLPTKVTLQGPASSVPDAFIQVTGQVTIQAPDGTWVPAPYTAMDMTGLGITPAYSSTDADGRFSFTAKSANGGAPAACVSPGDDATFATATCSARLVTRWTSYPVRITDFSPSHEPENPGNFGFFGAATYEQDDSGTEHPYIGTMNLAYLSKASNNWVQLPQNAWTHMATGTTDTDGYGSFVVSGFLPGTKGRLAIGGLWTVQTPAHGLFQADYNTLWAGGARVDAWTYLTGTKIVKRGKYRYLIGYLNDDHTVGPIPKEKVRIYTRPGKTYLPKYLATVTTASNGEFSFKLTGRTDYYQAVFPGTPMPGGDVTVGYWFNSNGTPVYYHS
jgi:hypothetical protein